MRIDVFFKKKIITIYLHPGPGKGRQEGLVWFYLQGEGWEGEGRRMWRPGGEARGQGEEILGPPTPVFLHFPPHNQLKSSLKAHLGVRLGRRGWRWGQGLIYLCPLV